MEKSFTKEMFRSGDKALSELSPVEFGFLISGMGESGEKGKGKREKRLK